MVSVHGADRPGIVHRVGAAIAAAGGNITDLSTRLAGDLYVLVAEVDLPGRRRAALAASAGRDRPASSASTRTFARPTPTCCEPADPTLRMCRMIRPVRARPCIRCCRAPAAPVDPDDPEVLALAVDLVETMRASPGCVGLAAPQLGEPVAAVRRST